MGSLTLDVHSPAISWRSRPGGALRQPAAGRSPAASGDEIKALVLRAREGEAEAFGALYDRYVELVYRYVYYRVGSHPLAEDLTSETFLRALRRLGSFTWQGKDVGAWFVTIARNLVADHYKSSRYRLELTTDDVAGSGAPPVVEGPEPPPQAVSGMSVLGNQEAPKSLVIVPWKTSELGESLGISPMLDDSRQPIDREVFLRTLSYYEIRSTTTRQDGAPAGTAAHRRQS